MKNKKQEEETRRELCILHPCGLLVYRDGKVLVPKSGKHPAHFTYGNTNNYGYKRVIYQGKHYYVHRLVAECFIDNPEGKPEVDHINMKKDENMVENLRWASRVEQMNFKDQNVKDRMVRKLTNGKCSKPVLQCDLDGNLVQMWPSTRECGRNGYNHSYVAQCCNDKYKREGNNVYKGFRWRYAEEEAIV